MDRDEIRRINRQMTERLLGAPPEPVTDGGYALRVLETRGRTSGRVVHTPVGVVGHDGQQYLVSPDLGRDWVRNLDVAGTCRLLSAGLDEAYAAHRLGVADSDTAAQVVLTYLRAAKVPWAKAAFPVSPDDDISTVVSHLDSIAVFSLDPADA